MCYYKDDRFKLLFGDSFDVLKTIPMNSVDMVFADPPYFLSGGGISCQSGKQVIVNKGEWDKPISCEQRIEYNKKWISLCRDLLKENGSIWISGTFHNIYSVGVALELCGFSIINNITWVKPNPAPNLGCRCFTNSTETILWARKDENGKKANHYFNYQEMKNINNGKQMKDVWEIKLPSQGEKKFGKHPTQKPVALLDRIIVASTKENDLVLDPFNGSGTTGVASILNKRRYIGIELEKEYLDLTIKRYNDIK
jgi:site-specific DNA-methyltransferase (adenine-specific)